MQRIKNGRIWWGLSSPRCSVPEGPTERHYVRFDVTWEHDPWNANSLVATSRLICLFWLTGADYWFPGGGTLHCHSPSALWSLGTIMTTVNTWGIPARNDGRISLHLVYIGVLLSLSKCTYGSSYCRQCFSEEWRYSIKITPREGQYYAVFMNIPEANILHLLMTCVICTTRKCNISCHERTFACDHTWFYTYLAISIMLSSCNPPGLRKYCSSVQRKTIILPKHVIHDTWRSEVAWIVR
jgi:hypothetical protein